MAGCYVKLSGDVEIEVRLSKLGISADEFVLFVFRDSCQTREIRKNDCLVLICSLFVKGYVKKSFVV